MQSIITPEQLMPLGLSDQESSQLIKKIELIAQDKSTPAEIWQALSQQLLAFNYSFPVHLFLFSSLFPNWHTHPETAPAWIPTIESIKNSNLAKFMREMPEEKISNNNVQVFHRWTAKHYSDFWQLIIKKLNIIFKKNPDNLCDLSHGIESPEWLPGAMLNIVDSCFNAPPTSTAIIYLDEKNTLRRLSYGELNDLSNRIAHSLIKQGWGADDAIAIIMPMNKYAVAIYLGIIKMGGVVVSIADSFSHQEITTRLHIAKTKAIFTQDIIQWDGKKLPLYEKIQTIDSIKSIVLACETTTASVKLQEKDMAWNDFLMDDATTISVPRHPMSPCNILFSSGTTAEPKAIVWNHTTPIKVASDAYFHQNIEKNDVLSWPSNLGWMMGPWLIFAALINHGSIALYPDAPKGRAFGEFIKHSNVTMLGLVPTLVAMWRQTRCMENIHWRAIKVFSSSGECSNPEDMLYLMSLAGYKPIIEYCGGTEIGGAYLSSTVIQPNYPSLFSTATMGLDLIILDEEGHPASLGEVALIPPSIGLSTTLLNADHQKVYFANMPKTSDGKLLRRHGDQIKQFPNGYYCILGRVDDTMNLGGIKISAAEIERAISGLPEIIETAAIAISPANNGPNQLIIYAATQKKLDKVSVKKEMQKKINSQLNPLFKIHDVVFINELPKTASNKIMRRMLRKNFNL